MATTNAETIFLPINIGAAANDTTNGGNHWALVVIKKSPLQVTYFDSLGHPLPHAIKAQLTTALPSLQNHDIHDLQLKVQHDNHSCGPWVVKAATAIVNHPNQASPTAISQNLSGTQQASLLASTINAVTKCTVGLSNKSSLFKGCADSYKKCLDASKADVYNPQGAPTGWRAP